MTPTPELLLQDAAWLRGLAKKLASPADRADDLVQDVSLAALQAPAARTIGRPWLAAVAGNLSRLFHRRAHREQRRLLRLARPAASPSAAELVEQAELQQRAVAAVLALPPVYRDTVLMRFLHGMSLEQTSARLRLPIETVRTRQRRALALLRERLMPDGGGERAVRGFTIVGFLMQAKTSTALVAGALVIAGALWVMSDPGAPIAPKPVAQLRPEPVAFAAPAPPSARVPAPEVEARDAAVPVPPPRQLPPPAPVVTEVPVTAPPGTAAIVVRVTWKDDGKEAPGVPVMCRPLLNVGPIVATDATGTARFDGIADGTYTVSAANRIDKQVDAEALVTKTVELRLPRGFVAHGRVVDPENRPVPFADILVARGGVTPSFVFPAGRADAHGRFRVDELSSGAKIGARHAEFGTTDFEMLRDARGEDDEVVLKMSAAGFAAVTGRVTDASGAPLAHAWVHLQQGGVVDLKPGARAVFPAPPVITSTDAQGRFAATSLRAGKRRLKIVHGTLAPHVESFELAAGEHREFAVVLQHGGELLCTVVDPDGNVAAGAEVSLPDVGYPQTSRQLVAGAQPLRFPSLAPGTHKVLVRKDPFPKCERTVEIAAGTTSTIEVRLDRGLEIRGQLVDAAGKPLARWWVDLGYLKRRSPTDEHGRFVLPECAATGNTLHFRSKNGFVPFALRVAGVDVDGRERTFVVGAECAPSARVRGQCLAIDGRPLAGVEVGVFQEHLQIDARRTADDGTFELDPLPPGPYRVYPTHRDARYEGIDFELKANDVLQLPPFTGRPVNQR
jgi:RNA polymerase sigma-70 factor (ECF subfamily)